MMPNVAATISTPLTAAITPMTMTKTIRKRQTKFGSYTMISNEIAVLLMIQTQRMNYIS